MRDTIAGLRSTFLGYEWNTHKMSDWPLQTTPHTASFGITSGQEDDLCGLADSARPNRQRMSRDLLQTAKIDSL